MRRKTAILLPGACLFIIAFTLYLRREQLRHLSRPSFLPPHNQGKVVPSATSTQSMESMSSPSSSAAQKSITQHEVLSEATKTAYVKAIMDPSATDLPRLECPKLEGSRYQQLKVIETQDTTIRYVFALDLRQCVTLLPRLIGSIVEAIRFLGHEYCALSIVEGNSDDGTGDVLAALRPDLEALGITYYLITTPINPKKGDRIAALAQLRNLALQPIIDQAADPPASSPKYTPNTTITFLNDVAICPEDILELLHQHQSLNADMVCAMDYTYVGPDPTFYDVWIARGMTGDSFFRIPPDGSWDFAWNLFWNDPDTQQRMAARRPFQVFSCWNGAAVFGAGAILEKGVRFRSVREGECMQGEPQLFCKDLWREGFGRIAVVPVVSLEYSDVGGRKIKEAKGYTSQWVGRDGWRDEGIEWVREPPERVKCMADYGNQFWEGWNVSLPGT